MRNKLMTLNNDDMVGVIADLTKNVSEKDQSSQPGFIPWVELPINMSYNSTTRLDSDDTSFDLTGFFSVGDPIRWNEGATQKYGYVFTVEPDYIRLTGGSDYEVTNTAITNIARGTTRQASGFPFIFNWDGNVTASAGSYSNADPAQFERFKFYVDGTVGWLLVDVENGSLTVPAGILMDLPIDADVAEGQPNMTVIVSDNFNSRQGYVKVASTIEIGTWKGSPLTLSTFVATTNGLNFSYQTPYLIDINQ